MKNVKTFINGLLMSALLALLITTVADAQGLQIAFTPVFLVNVVISAVVMPFVNLEGQANEGLLTELWEGELVDKMRWTDRPWMQRIMDKNQYVNKNMINLAEIGVDPEVLINNTTYPIPTSGREDTPLAVALHKYETENTKIPDDELYALPYDKKGSVINQHKVSLEIQIAKHGLHQMAPAADSSTTPIVTTTGNADDYGRKRLTPTDIIKLKDRLDTLEMSEDGRILVLCTRHVNDLLLVDQSFKDRYNNTETGKLVTQISGFDIYKDIYCPKYDASGNKKAFDAAAAGTDCNLSTFFHESRVFKAFGEVAMYYSEAKTDTDNRETKVGFRRWAIILNKTVLGTGGIRAVAS